MSFQTFLSDLCFQTSLHKERWKLRSSTQRLLLQFFMPLQPLGRQLQVPEDGPFPEMGISTFFLGNSSYHISSSWSYALYEFEYEKNIICFGDFFNFLGLSLMFLYMFFSILWFFIYSLILWCIRFCYQILSIRYINGKLGFATIG